jgi:membrane protease YdiL (CAAX protease family)
MLFRFKDIFDFEKKAIFLINFLLVVSVIIIFYLQLPMKYFFYSDIFLTLILSYLFFIKSKKLSRILIITNIFIFFYFLYPEVANFLYNLLGTQSYLFILLYNVSIAYFFLFLSGYHKKFYGDLSKMSLKVFFVVFILGIFLGLLFFWVKEPIPSFFSSVSNKGLLSSILFLLGSSFVVAFSEQIIFSGFLFNIYKNLTNKTDAIFQVSLIFVSFHLLRFKNLIDTYYLNFPTHFILYLIIYYILLFLFMNIALYLYSFEIKYKGKEYKGNIFYPILLHLVTDFSLFFFYYLSNLR